LRGLSGGSSDMRDLLARQREDPARAWLSRCSVHRARKYLGAYLAVLGGADAVVFSGGIGSTPPRCGPHLRLGWNGPASSSIPS
jgi:acetate kinase